MDALEIEAEWRACAADEMYFLTHYWMIRHPERGRILFDPYEAQISTLVSWNTERYTINLKARQIGFSTLAGAHAVWLAFFKPDRYIVMLSKAEREAVKLLAKAKYGYKHLPDWLVERGPRMTDNNQLKMSWDNDSSIEAMPSGEDPARGESVYLVIVDEWASLPNAEEAWASIEPITDIGGRVIGISTAKGSGNWFHTAYVGAKTGSNLFVAIFHPWSAADGRDAAWYAMKKRSLSATPWVLHQEYPQNDVECFVKSGMSVFDVDQLDELETEKPVTRGTFEALSFASKAAKILKDDEGPLHIWKLPIRDGRRYVIGADIAEGLEHGDYSVAHVIDGRTGDVVAKWRGHIAPDLMGSEILWHLGWLYGCALVGIEANSMGIATTRAMQVANYPNLYYRTSLDERSKVQSKKIGWYTSGPSKRAMIAELAKALRRHEDINEDGESVWTAGELQLLDSETIGELRTFVRDANGTMHGSPHDDQVMSLGIANQMRAFAHSPEWKQEETDPWSIAGWIEFAAERDNVGQGSELIGAHSGRRDDRGY